jgi:acetyl-CoA carboxylase carboxyl transferase subunit beta
MSLGSAIKDFFKRWKKGEAEDQSEAIPVQDERIFVAKKHQCTACHAHLEENELEANFYVCPECGHHFRITPKERIKFLLDGGVWEEFATEVISKNPIDFPDYSGKLEKYKQSSGSSDAIVTGFGKIKGKKSVVAIMNFKFMGGSMGSVVGEKLTRALVSGLEKKLPVVLFTTSGGARMQEGILSLMQMAKTSAAIAQLDRAGIPFFVVLTDPTYGGVTASFAMLGDIILAEPGASIGFAGPRVIEGTIKQKLPEGFQTSEFLLEKGFVDSIVTRQEMRSKLSMLIEIHAASTKGVR